MTSSNLVIKGLYYYPNFLSSDEGKALITELEKDKRWVGVTSSPKSRRVIHYGYVYSYTGGPLHETEPIPNMYSPLLDRFKKTQPMEDMKESFDQLIVNEYMPGQGIGAHIDHTLKFGPIVACLTLGSGVVIEFSKGGGTNPLEKESMYVQPNSLYVMSGDSRYVWKHSIFPKKSDTVNGLNIIRDKRLSLTFRHARK